MRKFYLFSCLGLAFVLNACAQQIPTPKLSPLGLSDGHSFALEKTSPALTEVLPAPYASMAEVVALPSTPIKIPRSGSLNALDIVVTQDLEEAYGLYFEGKGKAAIDALDRAERNPDLSSAVAKYHVAAQRMRTLIMMGQAAEAESFAGTVAERERAAFGRDHSALAFRSEARLWLGDHAGARRDALRVASSLSSWTLPTSYGGPPTNLTDLITITTAQLRAYTVLAGAAVFDGNASEALPWAIAAENGFEAVHFVGNHGLYGRYLRPYPDSYYGRAFNLMFLGAAKAEISEAVGQGMAELDRAADFFDAVGYRAGSVSNEALRAWVLSRSPAQLGAAIKQADVAVQTAIDEGFPDFIWRIETLRGELLFNDGRLSEAEEAYRRADASVDFVSGALATDRAKLRFGVGKELIGRRLALINAQKGDLEQLFADLERSRARSFVDMLADRPVAPGREANLVAEIKDLNERLRAIRTRAMAPNGGDQAARAEESRLLEKRAILIATLGEKDPELAAVHGATGAALEDVAAALDPTDRLLYALPIEEEQAVRFMAIDYSGARLIQADINGQDLRRLVVAFRDAVDSGNANSQARIARRLDESLDFSGLVAEGTTYIVPSGDLFFVPWGALPTTAAVVTLPNGGWVLREAAKRRATGATGIIGDPAFGGELPQLDGAREEAIAVAQLLDAAPIIGAQATRQAVSRKLGSNARLLHIASHGVFDAEEPLRSAIALSDGNRTDLVTAAELFAEPLAADLVVLSACETGMGLTVAGEDFLGLARSFYLGGARAVMNSLWPVDDAGTLAYMKVFHDHARHAGDYAGAWLAARRATQAAGFPPSVYGAFVLGGAKSAN